MSIIEHSIKSCRTHQPHLKLHVQLETTGIMPVGFDKASDFYLPLRYQFEDRFAPVVLERAMQLKPGKSGFGVVCTSLKTRGGSCDAWAWLHVSRPIPSKEIEELLTQLVFKPIVLRRLKAVFHEDSCERRIANRVARLIERHGHPEPAELSAASADYPSLVLAEDPPTHPDIRELLAAG